MFVPENVRAALTALSRHDKHSRALTMKDCAACQLPLLLVLMVCRLSYAWQQQQPPTTLKSTKRHRYKVASHRPTSRPLSAFPELSIPEFIMPFEEIGKHLTVAMTNVHVGNMPDPLWDSVADMGKQLVGNVGSNVPATTEWAPVADILESGRAADDAEALKEAGKAALGGLGRDVLTFLAASVAVVPLSKWLGVTPVLGFLATGCLLGPHGLGLFLDTEADLQLGDLGILFLLFSEGLNLSPERLSALRAFSGLGVLQILTSMGLFFFGILLGGPIVVNYIAPVIQMDDFIYQIFSSPVEAFCIAAAGALSSSAFVLPVLKEKKWEDKPEGIAALSILLLQDLAVAPLLVILPLLAGSGPQSSTELGVLVLKGTVGFGAVLAIGSVLLKYVFDVVAAARSTETFVATALLVALGMGQAAEYLGLSATTGAFAAGVLLAGNRYRAQIKADIRPFEGILLGIFFLTAGASLDPYVVANNLPTLVTGISVFIVTKALVLFVAGPSYGKTGAGAARVAITLSGGGEFSLVLFALAQDLGVLDDKLANLLTASVIISMSLTPLLGEVADAAGKYLEHNDGRRILADVEEALLSTEDALALFEGIDTNDSGTIEFDELRTALLERGLSYYSIAEIFAKFDENGDGFISQEEWTSGMEAGYLASALVENGAAVDAGGGQKVEAGMKIASDAIVICGFTEGAKDLYAVLEVAGITKNGGVVAFELSPQRVSAGFASGANIIYGDGASVSLMRAAGVTKPRAVIIMYRSEARRLEATERLKASLPDGTPIYTRVISGQSLGKKELLDAGATEVVNERTEAALRFGALLGAFRTSAEVAEMRTELAALAKGAAPPSSPMMEDIPGLPEDRLNDLADEFECTRRDLVRLFQIFSSLPEVGDDKFVDISDLRDVLLRTAGDGPIDDTALARWVERADIEGGGTLSFVDFARVYFGSPGRTARE